MTNRVSEKDVTRHIDETDWVANMVESGEKNRLALIEGALRIRRWGEIMRALLSDRNDLEAQLTEYKDAECRAVKLHGEALNQLAAAKRLCQIYFEIAEEWHPSGANGVRKSREVKISMLEELK